MKKRIDLEGMSCGHCVKHVQEALQALKGMEHVEVNLEEKYAIVETEIEDALLQEVVEEEGYDVIGIVHL